MKHKAVQSETRQAEELLQGIEANKSLFDIRYLFLYIDLTKHVKQ